MNTYCVICCDRLPAHKTDRRAVRFYLGAASATDALAATAEEYPALRVLGIEVHGCPSVPHSKLSAA
jgi:hypothetical protein